jgi:hypothetical protein
MVNFLLLPTRVINSVYARRCVQLLVTDPHLFQPLVLFRLWISSRALVMRGKTFFFRVIPGAYKFELFPVPAWIISSGNSLACLVAAISSPLSPFLQLKIRSGVVGAASRTQTAKGCGELPLPLPCLSPEIAVHVAACVVKISTPECLFDLILLLAKLLPSSVSVSSFSPSAMHGHLVSSPRMLR